MLNYINFFVYTLLVSFVIGSCQSNRNRNSVNQYYLDTIFNKKEGTIEIYTKLNDKKHGEMLIYNDNFIIEEGLFINNRKLIKLTYGEDKEYYGYTYFYNFNDTLYPIGSITYRKKDNKKEQIMCSYFEVFSKDTVYSDETLDLELVGNLGLKSNFRIKVCIGELNEFYEFINNDSTIYLSDSNSINLNIKPKRKGINLITGKIYYFKNKKNITKENMMIDIGIPYIFYKQFYVKGKE